MQVSELQPMRVSDILDASFRLYRTHFTQLLSLVTFTFLPMTIVRLLLLANPAANSMIDVVQSIFFLPLMSAVITVVGARIYWNEPMTAAQAYRAGLQRYLSILGATLLQGLIIGLPAVVIGGCFSLALVNSSLSASVTIALLIMLLLPFFFAIGTKYAVTFPAIMVEGVPAIAAMSRSWSLTTGKFWQAAGVLTASSLLTVLIAQIPTLMISSVVDASGSESLALWLSATRLVLTQLGLIVTLPFQYLVSTVLYYDLRIRNEGYDLERASSQVASQQAA